MQSVMRTALQDAVMNELIETNPLYGWSYLTKEAPKKIDDVDPFNTEEQEAILNELEGQAKNLIKFNFWTGMHPSEVIALNWQDIDWNRGVILVTKALTEAALEAETPKTLAGKREVKILKPAMEALLDQKKYTSDKNEEIFQNPNTKERWTGDQPIRKTLWTPALKKAKVRYRRPYQTHHTYAT
jgi:integrase